MYSILIRLISIGNLPDDSQKAILKKQSMCVMGYVMAVGGLVWGAICLPYELYWQSMIPFGYTICTIFNFTFFYKTKRFGISRTFQLLISILLPFFFQWSLGGFVPSGAVMLWAILALLASISFQNLHLAKKWLVLYLVLIIVSGFTDNYFSQNAVTVDSQLITIFFVLNISVVSSMVIALVTYFVGKENRTNIELQKVTEEIRLNNEELNTANEELNTTLELVNRQNKDIQKWKDQIQSSINYAARIQDALLPLNEEITWFFPGSFLLFKPRDTVSGDFYWFRKIDDRLILTVADCTGHGIPGAFMSMLGAQALTDITTHYPHEEAGNYLTRLDWRIRETLKQNQNRGKDGMDMVLIILDAKTRKVQVAGAKNRLFYIQNKEIQVIKGAKYPIGGEQYRETGIRTYPCSVIDVSIPTTIYLFSDGYQDQFGGKKNKKFMVKHFRNLLFEIHQLPMFEQRQILDRTIEDWMSVAKAPQTDDICIMGLEL